MAPKSQDEERYWPIGLIGHASEIRSLFPEEAELIGAITILWNHHERHLRDIFVRLLRAKSPEFAEAIWHRQPTHQAKRNLLALALEHARLTKRQRMLLEIVIDRTKTFADRRNDLLHGEYYVKGETNQLFARIRSPNSTKPPRYQKNTVKDLEVAAGELEELMAITGALSLEFVPIGLRRKLDSFAKAWRETRPEQPAENPQIGFPPQSGRRRP